MTLDKNLSLTAAMSAIIFASTVPVEVTKLAAHFEVTAEDIMSAAQKIKEQFDNADCGIRLRETDGKYSFSTKPEYGEKLKKDANAKPYPNGHPTTYNEVTPEPRYAPK